VKGVHNIIIVPDSQQSHMANNVGKDMPQTQTELPFIFIVEEWHEP